MRDHCDIVGDRSLAWTTAARRFRRSGYLGVAAAMLTFIMGATAPAVGRPLVSGAFDALAKECAGGISADVLRAVASKESHFEPFALHNNTRKLTHIAGGAKAAIALAEKWIAAGDSVDVGLMQINTANLAPLGLTVAQAFDPCFSLAAGAAVLRAAYSKGASAVEQQAALLIMLSRYNTGRPLNGLVNGYVGEVIAAGSDDRVPRSEPAVVVEPQESQTSPWDVWAGAAYAKAHGATWIVDLTPARTPPLTQAKTDHQTRKP